jgi:predicted chitinase
MCVMPGADRSKIEAEYYVPINAALSNGHMTNLRRIAGFIGVVAHVTVDLKHMKVVGCKEKFCGRGPLMIAGSNWYTMATDDLDLDLDTNPELAEKPVEGFRFASWFWTNKNYNRFANFKNFKGLCKQFGGVDSCLDKVKSALECMKGKNSDDEVVSK